MEEAFPINEVLLMEKDLDIGNPPKSGGTNYFTMKFL